MWVKCKNYWAIDQCISLSSIVTVVWKCGSLGTAWIHTTWNVKLTICFRKEVVYTKPLSMTVQCATKWIMEMSLLEMQGLSVIHSVLKFQSESQCWRHFSIWAWNIYHQSHLQGPIQEVSSEHITPKRWWGGLNINWSRDVTPHLFHPR